MIQNQHIVITNSQIEDIHEKVMNISFYRIEKQLITDSFNRFPKK